MHNDFSSENEPKKKSGGCCRKCGVCCCISVVIVMIPISLSYFGLFPDFSTGSNYYCQSAACVQSSSEILNFINTTIDPCENFEEFVCGNFKEKSYENQIDSPLSLELQRINNRLNAFIIQPTNDNEDSEAVQFQKQYFQACLNLEEIDRDRDRTFFNLIDEIGGWPLTRRFSWVEKRFNWLRTIVKCQQIGLPFDWFLNFDVIKDNNNENGGQYVLVITPPKKCNSVDDLNSHEYVNMMANVVMNITGKEYTFSELSKVVNFQQKLAEVNLKQLVYIRVVVKKFFELCELHREDKLLRKYVRDLQQLVPKGDWIDFISALTGRKWRLPSNTRIIYNIQHYLPKLDHLLHETSKSVQANYIVWKMIEYFAPYLSKPIRETHFEYIKNKVDEEQPTRFQFCLDETKSKFPCLSQIEYVKKYTRSDIMHENINAMIDSIREQFVEFISESSWVDQDLKNDSIAFYVEEMERVIGSLNDLDTQKQIEKLKFKTNNIIEMLTEVHQRDSAAKFDTIGRIEKPEYNCIDNVGLDIEINFEENKIFVPAGLLNDFFYNTNKQNYLNFASLGTLLATKLTNFDVISENGTETFQQCLADDLETSETELKDTLQLVFGRDVAYSSYLKWTEVNGNERPLPALDAYTPNQLFWIKSSLSYCYQHLISEESAAEQHHNKFIQSLKHSRFFSDDFQCAPGSAMNPENKCLL